MASKFSKGPWRLVKNHRGIQQVMNGHRDPIADVYSPDDAPLLRASKELLGHLKHLLAIVRMHEGELRASERAKYEAARALVRELNGEHQA